MAIVEGGTDAPVNVSLGTSSPAPVASAPAAPTAPAASSAAPYTAQQIKDIMLPAAQLDSSNAWKAYNDAVAAAGGRIDIDQYGRAMKEVPTSKKIRLADGTFINDMTAVEDTSLTNLYTAAKAADARAKQMESDLKDGLYGVARTGAAGIGAAVDTEGGTSSEVARRFKDFMDKAKSIYALQDSEQDYGVRAAQSNMEQMQGVRKGLLAPGAMIEFGDRRPSPLYSMMAREAQSTDRVLPDYRPNYGFGLPGEGSFAPSEDVPTPDDYGGIIGGFAEGTLKPGQSFEALDPNAGVDKEIAWMIGMPDILFDMNAPPVPVPASWQKGKASG